MKSKVFLTKIDDNGIYFALNRLFDKLNLPSQINKIGIKINLCDYRRRESGVTTDYLVLDSLLMILRNRFPKAFIFTFEHDATGTLADNLFKWLRLDKVVEKHRVAFVNLANQSWKKIQIDGYHFKEIEVPNILLDSLVINHPKLKTHGRTKITCGLKNMYGCYRIKNKIEYHPFLDKAIADINIAIPSNYVIVDGLLCLEGNRGPTQGYPKEVGVFVGGNDIVAVDSFCSKFMGFHPHFVKHIRLAASKKVGSINYQLESELSKKTMKNYKFKFNLWNYYMMQILRKVVKS